MTIQNTISRNQLAAWLGVTPQHVGRLARQGVLRRNASGRFILEGAVERYLEFTAAAAVKRAVGSGDTMRRHQIRRLEGQIARADLELITMEEAVAAANDLTARMGAAIRSVGAVHAGAKATAELIAAEFEAKAKVDIDRLVAGA